MNGVSVEASLECVICNEPVGVPANPGYWQCSNCKSGILCMSCLNKLAESDNKRCPCCRGRLSDPAVDIHIRRDIVMRAEEINTYKFLTRILRSIHNYTYELDGTLYFIPLYLDKFYKITSGPLHEQHSSLVNRYISDLKRRTFVFEFPFEPFEYPITIIQLAKIKRAYTESYVMKLFSIVSDCSFIGNSANQIAIQLLAKDPNDLSQGVYDIYDIVGNPTHPKFKYLKALIILLGEESRLNKFMLVNKLILPPYEDALKIDVMFQQHLYNLPVEDISPFDDYCYRCYIFGVIEHYASRQQLRGYIPEYIYNKLDNDYKILTRYCPHCNKCFCVIPACDVFNNEYGNYIYWVPLTSIEQFERLDMQRHDVLLHISPELFTDLFYGRISQFERQGESILIPFITNYLYTDGFPAYYN